MEFIPSCGFEVTLRALKGCETETSDKLRFRTPSAIRLEKNAKPVFSHVNLHDSFFFLSIERHHCVGIHVWCPSSSLSSREPPCPLPRPFAHSHHALRLLAPHESLCVPDSAGRRVYNPPLGAKFCLFSFFFILHCLRRALVKYLTRC